MAELITLEQARQRVRAAADTLVEFASVSLLDAVGHRLAEDHHAAGPWPATDRAAMDGYAVRAGGGGLAEGTRLRVVGACPAGQTFSGTVADGQCIRIMTGASVPAVVDAVVPVEATSGYVEVGGEVELRGTARRGANIRPAGSEVAAGQRVLRSGQRIGPAEVGALAALGVDPVPVFRRPVVAILATGDEVVPIDVEPTPWQVRNSNAYALAAQVTAAGGAPLLLGIAADTEEALRAKLTEGLERADVLLTIGGVSKGTHDLVHRLLEQLGVEKVFHGVRLKPGKPVFFGTQWRRGAGEITRLPARRFVFGLPGNPASTFTVFDLLVVPLLGQLAGACDVPEPLRARVGGLPFRQDVRLQAVPARLRTDGEGVLWADLGPSKPSGDPFGLLDATGYALVAPEHAPSADGTVEICPYGGGA